MAEPDMAEPTISARIRPLWSELVGGFFGSLSDISTGAIALAGAVWYGFLWISYNRFYEPLGITPSDVGLNYASILANSVGAAVAFLIPLIAVAMTLIIFTISVRFRGYRYTPERHVYWRTLYTLLTRNLLIMIIVMGLIFIAFLVYTFPVTARFEAQRVIHGEAVTPLHTLWSPAPILTIHADPVIAIKSIGAKKTGESVAVESLALTSLLYMGQANGMIVLYDSSTDQAIYLPASSVLLTVKAR